MENNQHEAFCALINAAIGGGVQFVVTVQSDINGEPYVRQWPLASIKNTGTAYEVFLHGYGIGEIPHGAIMTVKTP